MKAVKLWQGKSSRISGRVQIALSENGILFIRGSSYCSSGGSIRFNPRFEKWRKLKKCFDVSLRKVVTQKLEIYGVVTASQIGGAYRLKLPSS